MPRANTGSDAVRLALERAIPTTPLPALPTLSNDVTWRTHTSYRAAIHHPFEAPEDEHIADYERLEHVGDAVLGAEISLITHEMYPRLVVGMRSLVKAALVANTTLSLISVALGLPPRLLSATAQAHQFRTNPHIQACMFEAFLATLHDEQGPVVLREFLRAIYAPLLPVVIETFRPFHAHDQHGIALAPAVNYVGLLMEWKVAKGRQGARRLEFTQHQSGRPDQATWVVECRVVDDAVAELAQGKAWNGTHSSVRGAKNVAAAHACKDLGIVKSSESEA
ncbi:hypothetical protein JCM11491_000627 [Sporobolomyces phaffii]